MGNLNRSLVVPVAALVTALFKQAFNIEIDQENIETTINTLLIAITGIGIFVGRKKVK